MKHSFQWKEYIGLLCLLALARWSIMSITSTEKRLKDIMEELEDVIKSKKWA